MFWLPDNELVFPHPSLAEPNGLLAVGGDLSPERLVLAYINGIFPWYEEDGQFYWYSPDPRCVLLPQELRIHKSMRSIFNQKKFPQTVFSNYTNSRLNSNRSKRYALVTFIIYKLFFCQFL